MLYTDTQLSILWILSLLDVYLRGADIIYIIHIIYILYVLHIYIYIYIYIYISGHKWSTKHRVFKYHSRKMSVIYMLSWKQCVLPVTTPMAHVPRCMSYHKAIVVITGKAHCLHDNIYVYTYIYIYIYIYYIYMYVCLHLYYYYCNLLN